MAIRIKNNKVRHVVGTKRFTQPRSDLVKRRIEDAHKEHYESKNHIIIKDWAGNVLYQGHCDSSQVDRVLKANKCSYCSNKSVKAAMDESGAECGHCNGTGYSGDFSVYWLDENDSRNVYEFINY